jgi:cytochrome b
LALLIVSAVQAVSGLFASDELADDGPLAAHVGTRTVRWMTRLHVWNQNVLLVLIAVHIAAVLGHLLYKRDDLIGPMLTGRRPGAEIPPLRFVSAWRALGVFLASAALVALLLWWAGT